MLLNDARLFGAIGWYSSSICRSSSSHGVLPSSTHGTVNCPRNCEPRGPVHTTCQRALFRPRSTITRPPTFTLHDPSTPAQRGSMSYLTPHHPRPRPLP